MHVGNVTANNQSFFGAIFDGRYSQGDFQTLAAWSSCNLTRKDGAADLTIPGYQGAAFDGRYVYFAPAVIGTGSTPMPSGNVATPGTSAASSRISRAASSTGATSI
jgi:hypothetical protein